MTKIIRTLPPIARLLRRGLCSSPLDLEMAELDELVKGVRDTELINAACTAGTSSKFLHFVSQISASWSAKKKSVMDGFPPDLQDRITSVERILGNPTFLNPELLAKALLHPSFCPTNLGHKSDYSALVHDGSVALEMASVKYNLIFGGFDEGVPEDDRVDRALFLVEDGCTILSRIRSSVFQENAMLARSLVASGIADLVVFGRSPTLTADIANLQAAIRKNDFSFVPSKIATTFLSDALKAVCGSTLGGSMNIDHLLCTLRQTLAPDSNPLVCLYSYTRSMGGDAPFFQSLPGGSYNVLVEDKVKSYPPKPANDHKILLATGTSLAEAAWNAWVVYRKGLSGAT